MRLIGQDCNVIFYDGGVQTVAAGGPIYGSGIPIKAFARSIKSDESSETVDMRGLGDGTQLLRHKYAKESIEVELLIETTGPVNAVKGHYGKIEVYLLSTLNTPIVYAGLVTKVSFNIPDSEQMQNFTIECGAD